MLVIVLRGGLGNQMFQFEAGKLLGRKFNQRVFYSYFYSKREIDSSEKTKTLENLNIDKIDTLPRILDVGINLLAKLNNIVFSKLFHGKGSNSSWAHKLTNVHAYQPFQLNHKLNLVDAYFQNVKYFQGMSANDLKELSVTKKYIPSMQNQEMLTKIKNSNSVCVHIRRGDYTSSKWAQDLLICDESYYVQAMNRLIREASNPVFYIFSNTHSDIEWIKQNYTLPGTVVYVDLENKDFQELYLMSNCKNFILSNSSFSWWAQELATGTGMVIAPDRWNNRQEDTSGIYQPNWTTIKVPK